MLTIFGTPYSPKTLEKHEMTNLRLMARSSPDLVTGPDMPPLHAHVLPPLDQAQGCNTRPEKGHLVSTTPIMENEMRKKENGTELGPRRG